MTVVLTARVDGDLQTAFEKFKQINELTNSQALRMLMSMGLANVDKLDVAWKETALREGQFAGVKQVHDALRRKLI